jgi:acyl-CoA synthetase (AMP-forming)/AMP-acid ligase II
MQSQPELQLIILDNESYAQQNSPTTASFGDFFGRGETSQMPKFDLAAKKSLVRASDIINYQFTSGVSTAKLSTWRTCNFLTFSAGTTGAPKAAMLSHV